MPRVYDPAKSAERYRNRTPEQVEVGRQQRAAIYATITPEQREARRIYGRAHSKKLHAGGDPITDAKRAKRREEAVLKERKRREQGKIKPYTPEQKRKKAAYMRERSRTLPPKTTTPEQKAKYAARAACRRAEKKAKGLPAWKRRSELSPEHLERLRAKARERKRTRKATDPSFVLVHRLRERIRTTVRLQGQRKSAKTEALVGCTIRELCSHLEAQFRDGMSWSNMGDWHVDHKRPCAAFDLTDPAQQRQCFHFTNLQPLWAVDNLRKGARH